MNQDLAFVSITATKTPSAPVWLTTTPSNEADPSIARLGAAGDEYLVGWMYWHYKNWGDPTTVSGETGAQGLFSQDSDLTTLKAGKADLLVRPYPQATAGIPLQLAFDPQTKVFAYRYAPRPATAPTEIFVPDRHYPNGFDVTVEGATVSEQTAQRVLLLNVCGAREVDVVIRPR